MKERPILMSAPMVRAVLAGTKTQTRRVMKPQPIWTDTLGGMWRIDYGDVGHYFFTHTIAQDVLKRMSKYGAAGDRLWVKETFSAHGAFGDNGRKFYRADTADGLEPNGLHWKPAIFCSRAASRITLEVASVRVERLQEITEADAIAEGIERVGDCWQNYEFKTAHPGNGVEPNDREHRITAFKSPIDSYRSLWNSINGHDAWVRNPWVWVITINRLYP